MKTITFGIIFGLSALAGDLVPLVSNEAKLHNFAQVDSTPILSRRQNDHNHDHDRDHEHDHNHDHPHPKYRNNRGAYIVSNNYIGLGATLIAGGLGGALTLFSGTLSASIRSFTTGVLLSLVFCKMIASSIQSDDLPHALAYIGSLSSGLAMMAMFSAHLFDYVFHKSQQKTVVFLVYVALMIHSCTSGVVLGMKKDQAIISFLISASLQRLLFGMALGMVILDAGFSSLLIPTMLLVTFAIACPAAALVGIQLKDKTYNATHALIEGSLEAIGAGLLIYVVFVALLSRSFSGNYSKASKLQKWLAVVALYTGTASIAVLSIWCR